MIRQAVMLIAAAGFGTLAAGGVLTVLISVGLVPRFAQRTGTAGSEYAYGSAIILGTVAGGFLSVFPQEFALGPVFGSALLVFIGIFFGMFEGCVAIAIAEIIDAMPIFERRMQKSRITSITSMKPVVSAIAVGKMAGSLWYFYNRIFRYGG